MAESIWPGYWLDEHGITLMFLLGTCLILIPGLFFYVFSKGPSKLDLPTFQVTDDVVQTIEKAHAECPDTPFALSLPGMELVVLPVSEIETIKGLPESEVSIKKHHYNVFLGEYSYMGTKADEFDAAMRYTLTRNTPIILASFTAEVDYATTQNIGPCEDWTAVKPRGAMSRVAALLSGRAFVGLPLSREEKWVEATVNYTGDVSRAWMILRLIPWYIRPFVAPFLPQVKSLKRQRDMTEKMLAPLLAAKVSTPTENEEKKIPGGDVIDWFRQQYKGEPTVAQLGRDQLLATFASIYNLSNALTYVVFDLAAHPECVAELRDELDEVLKDGEAIDKQSLPKLQKLDSFVKESQRLSPPSLVNIPRIVTNPRGLKLSTGHVVPFGTLITIRSHSINTSEELYPDPDKFDPFRFSRLRSIPGNELKHQHATTGVDNINFGHGIWACPGRFFASAEIKVVVAHFIRTYDIKLKEGEKKPKQQHFGLAILPDPIAEVLFKARHQM